MHNQSHPVFRTKSSPRGRAWSTGAVVCGLDLSETKAARQRPWLLQEPHGLHGTHRLHKQHVGTSCGCRRRPGPETQQGGPGSWSRPTRWSAGDGVTCAAAAPMATSGSTIPAAAQRPGPPSALVAEPGSVHHLGCHQHSGGPRLPCCEGHRGY